MSGVIYILCTATALASAWFLLRGYGRSQYRLLFWSGLCFSGFALNNFLVFFDKSMLPFFDLTIFRLIVGFLSISILLYGLIWDAK